MTWIYEKNSDNTARFVLGETGFRPLICIGVNPSTATPEKLDPTLRIVKRLSEHEWKCDGWIMLNLYPQRATNPNDLHRSPDSTLLMQNFKWIREICSRYSGCMFWAAWGGLIEKRSYLFDIVSTLHEERYFNQGFGCALVKRGPLSKDGHPHHPLYVKASAEFEPFRFADYIFNLNVARS